MPEPQDLLDNNRAWAADVTARDARFFARLAEQQRPEHLWIGCSDSRVPANEITGLAPGEVFVHRNVANQVFHSDLNVLSVLEHGVQVLKVRHVIVCGHYGCGGVHAAYEDVDHGLVDNWLQQVRDLRRDHRDTLEGLADDATRIERLCELNVAAQVRNVCDSTVVRQAWARGQTLTVHGWIYRIQDGLLHDLEVTTRGRADLAALDQRYRDIAARGLAL